MSAPDEKFEELASLHAFGLLEGAERAEFEKQLESDAALRARYEALCATANALAFSAPAAETSRRLRDRVMASVASEAPGAASAPVAVAPIVRPNFTSWIAWGVAAALAVSIVGLGSLQLKLQRSLQIERDRNALREVERQQLANALETERILAAHQALALSTAQEKIAHLQQEADVAQLKISALASLLSDSPDAQAIAVWNPTQQKGVLTVSKLPALAADKDYQLWVVDPAYPNPVDGGVFTVDAETGEARIEFTPDQPINQVAKFAVSLERKGGVPKAEGPMVLLSL